MSESKSSRLIERLDKLNEFERQPVTADKLQSGRHFAGLFAGEHVAATEFVIGALFVKEGAHTCDVIVGLIFGNLLAVLSWALICAPIAVRTRLTLYWYLRKVGGPIFMVIYNILNAVMYCILAGSMITVSASAVRIGLNIFLDHDIPDQIGWLPTDFRFVFIVLLVGAVVVTLAIWGFKKLAQFATICSPWMFLMFIAGALTMIPALVSKSPEIQSLRSFHDFWQLADTRIWPGPQAGQEGGLGFLHIASFAWICNLAMHLGLSDMALFRYAKKASYGFYSAFGMYLGHYLAWICAGIMGAGAAVILNTPLTELDSGSVAYAALGGVGALAVLLAGWTTSNPTIYRAGLALQVATPNWPRWMVTLIAGTITTIIACSPFAFTRLLDFIGIYGLLLMPVGAIVFVEFWIFPRIGLAQFWTERKNKLINIPALSAWLATLLACVFLWHFDYIHMFFLIVPAWFSAAFLYIILAYLFGAGSNLPELPQADTSGLETRAPQGDNQPSSRLSPSLYYYLPGVIAVAALVFCLGVAVWSAFSQSVPYRVRIEQFKVISGYLTVVYFVSAMAWVYLKEKRENRLK